MHWSFMNDDAGLAGETCENWLITADESDNAEIVAVVPKTGDEEYDNDVTFHRVLLISSAPELLEACRAAMEFLEDGTPEDSISPLEASTRRLLIAAIKNATGAYEPL